MSESFETARPASAAVIRDLPHSIESEEFVLSACFIDGAETLMRCQEAGVGPDTMYESKHTTVMAAMLDLHALQLPIDVGSVAQLLRDRRELDQIGSYSFLTQISSRMPTTATAAYHIEVCRRQHLLRQLIRGATGLVEECYNYSGSFDERINPGIERLTALLGGRQTARNWPQAVKEAEDATRERMKPPEQRKASEIELSWGLADFDRFFQPIEVGELVVIGGYTSSGKSSLLRNVMWNFARAGHPALMETVETLDYEEAINFAAQLSGIRSRGRLHELHPRDQEKLLGTFQEMLVPHFAVSHEDHNVRSIFGRALAFKRKNDGKLRALGVDYLQLLEDVQRARTSSERAIAIGNVTGACKQFATREKLAVLLLSGFNREYIKGNNREPLLSDLEGGSAIEKDASRVLLLHIPTEYYLHEMKYTQSLTADATEQPRFFVKVIQAKGRNAGTSSLALYFHRETKRFEMIAR